MTWCNARLYLGRWMVDVPVPSLRARKYKYVMTRWWGFSVDTHTWMVQAQYRVESHEFSLGFHWFKNGVWHRKGVFNWHAS